MSDKSPRVWVINSTRLGDHGVAPADPRDCPLDTNSCMSESGNSACGSFEGYQSERSIRCSEDRANTGTFAHELVCIAGEESELILERFFGVRFSIASVVDASGDVSGFIGVIIDFAELSGGKQSEAAEDRAARVWCEQFKGKIFDDVASLIMTYMDCVNEQRNCLAH